MKKNKEAEGIETDGFNVRRCKHSKMEFTCQICEKMRFKDERSKWEQKIKDIIIAYDYHHIKEAAMECGFLQALENLLEEKRDDV